MFSRTSPTKATTMTNEQLEEFLTLRAYDNLD
jgi:hypothetical protein